MIIGYIACFCGEKTFLIKIDKHVFYDVYRDKIILWQSKQSMFLPEDLRKSHKPIKLNDNTYEFYQHYVLINKQKVRF